MAKITISALGLEIPVESGSSIEKYFKNALKLRPAADVAVKPGTRLANPINAPPARDRKLGGGRLRSSEEVKGSPTHTLARHTGPCQNSDAQALPRRSIPGLCR